MLTASKAFADASKFTLGFDIYHGDDDHGDVQFGAAANPAGNQPAFVLRPRQFGIIKSSQGSYQTDPHCAEHCDRAAIVAGERDFLFSIYHFMTSEAATSQMRRFQQAGDAILQKYRKFMIRLMLDIERDADGSLPPVAVVKEMIAGVKEWTGKDPILYFAAADYAEHYQQFFPPADYFICLARYASNDPTPNPDPLILAPAVPGIAFHQFTGTGRLPGQSPAQAFDEDVYYGPFADLKAKHLL